MNVEKHVIMTHHRDLSSTASNIVHPAPCGTPVNAAPIDPVLFDYVCTLAIIA